MPQTELNLMLVSAEPEELKPLAEALGALVPGKQAWAQNSKQAMDLTAPGEFQLVVVGEKLDSDPLRLINELLQKDAFINTVAVSGDSEADFHEKSEGLGVLLKLPVRPDPKRPRRSLTP